MLNKEFGQLEGAVRAKKRPYIPVVLSREEINAIVNAIDPSYRLIIYLLYGCGLRLFECLNLRVESLNFDAELLTIHDGKGKKDRTVPIPQVLQADLKITSGLSGNSTPKTLKRDIQAFFWSMQLKGNTRMRGVNLSGNGYSRQNS